ncbi:MAG: CDP-alcohol phosphatidyltransferase family protein [Candidatus Aminicenantes bacterium]
MITQKKKSIQNFTTSSEYLKASKRSGHPLINRYVKVNAWINRPLAWAIVRVLKPTKITPNQVSVASFMIGIGGAACFAMGSPTWFIAGGILTQLSSIVDCADGMLARAKDQGTEFGKYLDIFLDRIVEFVLFGAIGFGMYRYTGHSLILILALLGSAAYFLHVCLYYITIHYYHNKVRGDTSESRALLLFLILIFAVINQLDIAIGSFLAATLFTNLLIIIDFFRSSNKKPPT